MKDALKHAACLNCGRPLADQANFCPHCGQENTANRFKLASLLSDFFSNYFSFDSKLSRSTVPFLVKPGFLTNKFNEGKRVGYVHPLRLYFIISFFFFFFLSMLIDSIVIENKLSLKSALQVKASDIPQAALAQLDTAQLNDADKAEFEAFEKKLQDKTDSALIQTDLETEERVLQIMRNDTLSEDELMEQLKVAEGDSFKRSMVLQARKVLQKDMDVFLPYLIKNLSIMMFLLLPVFAFFLYILFRRRERYYISHVIHALHLHSFSFLILTLLVFIELFTDTNSIAWLAFACITVYAFFSVKRVYGQGWLRTFLKFNVLGLCYFMTLFIAVLIEVGVSFMLF